MTPPVNHANFAIYFVDLKTSAALLQGAECATPRLAANEIARFAHLVQSRGADEAQIWRASHIALRMVLERFAGVSIRGTTYVEAAGGRPSLEKGFPHFSLAHTGTVALIAVSGAGTIGVDIEALRSLTFTPDRRQKLEAAAIRLAPDTTLPKDGDARTLQAWVRLEAHAKAVGSGIGAALTEAGVVGGIASEPKMSSTNAMRAMRDLVVPGNYFAAVSAAALPATLQVEAFPSNKHELAEFLAAAGARSSHV